MIGAPTISAGMFRSVVSRRMIASCCQSFSPKMATSGKAISSNVVTTVATPSKGPGRDAPSIGRSRPETLTLVA